MGAIATTTAATNTTLVCPKEKSRENSGQGRRRSRPLTRFAPYGPLPRAGAELRGRYLQRATNNLHNIFG